MSDRGIGTASQEPSRAGRQPVWVPVRRRSPVLRPARGGASGSDVFGLDLTAGCGQGCPFCYIRGLPWAPGEGRVLFDPEVADRLEADLDRVDRLPRQVILSPSSDPFPPGLREVRAAAGRVVRLLVARGIPVVLMTRGEVPRDLIEVLAKHPDRATVVPSFVTGQRALGRILEPWASSPWRRLRAIRRCVEAGIAVEVRLEPMIPGLTDTRENLGPLFEALAAAGVGRVVSHFLFLHTAMVAPLQEALAPLGWAEKLEDAFASGPAFAIGSIGTTKHLPREERVAGLARLASWGAEFGIRVETGAAQNPDLRRSSEAIPDDPPTVRDGAPVAFRWSRRKVVAKEPIASP